MGKVPRRRRLRLVRQHSRPYARGGIGLLPFLRVRTIRHRASPPPQVVRWLSEYGGWHIQGLIVCRKPIREVLNAVVRGVLASDRIPYDKLYHLWLHVHLGPPDAPLDQSRWRHFDFEKSEVVHVQQVSQFQQHTCPDHLEAVVPLMSPPLTLLRLFSNVRHRYSDDRLWVYDPVHQNCQRFVWDLLSSSNMATPQLETFILQDVRKQFCGLGHLAARGITDFASYLRRLSGGTETEKSKTKTLEQVVAALGDPDTTLEATAVLAGLPAPPTGSLLSRPPLSAQARQAEEVRELKRTMGHRNAFLNEIAAKASQINPPWLPQLQMYFPPNSIQPQILTPPGPLVYNPLVPPAEIVQEHKFYQNVGYPPGFGPFSQQNQNQNQNPAEEQEVNDLLGMDFDELSDELFGDGCGCLKCELRGGCASCRGAAIGCYCHTDKHHLGTFAAPPSAYLTGSNPETGVGVGVGGNFFTDIRDTFKTAFSKAGDVLTDTFGKVPVIGLPLRVVGEVYNKIAGRGFRERYRRERPRS